MDDLGRYFLSITTAGLVCSIIKSLVGSKSGYGTVISLVCGVFMAVTVISPWINWNIIDLTSYTDDIKADAQHITDEGISAAEMELRTIIKKETETYILDKAASLETVVQVNVTLQEDEPIPASVVIVGDVSPYKKTVLSNYMEDSLSIPEDAQQWS